jgi:hypothetical protein
MAYDSERLDAIFARTDGQCHLCRKKLVRKNYGNVNSRGAWEVEHSKPRSMGGTDHLNNLYAACVPCNRSKGNASTQSARSVYGFKAAPHSKVQKTKNGIVGAGAAGGIAWFLAPPQIKIPAMLVSMAFGALLGSNSEPE